MIKTITINQNNCSNWSNARDTGYLKWPGGSWKDYWIEYSGKEWPKYCCRENCHNEAIDGAHVICTNSDIVFICPLCSDHNPRSKDYPQENPRFSIAVGSVLVNADYEKMDLISKGKNKVTEVLNNLRNS